MNVSVVVPTFGRSDSLIRTIRSIAASLRDGFEGLDILIVDDGSPLPVAPLVEAALGSLEAEVRVVRQPNAGPAAARNHGFRLTSGHIVLFVDNDIEVPPTLVSAHVDAHRRLPDSVVFGRCLLPSDGGDQRLRCLLDGLEGDTGSADFEPSTFVASGQLSVERASFAGRGGVYREDLRTPAAEEYDLSFRLRKMGIPVLRANRIIAVHRTDLSLEAVCRGQYQHGRGCAEVAAKAPETLGLFGLKRIVEREQVPVTNVMGFLRRVASSHPARRFLCKAGHAAGKTLYLRRLAPLLYRWAISAYFMAGVREGLRDFRQEPR